MQHVAPYTLDKIEHKKDANTLITSLEYEYDLDGLRTEAKLPSGDSLKYTYDDLNRLASETKESEALVLDGTDDCVSVAQGSGELGFYGKSAVTLECWLNVDYGEWESDGMIFDLGAGGGHGCLYFSADRVIYGYVRCGNQYYYVITDEGVLPDDEQFHHIALSWGNNLLSLYLDGELVASTQTSGTLSGANEDFWVGSYENSEAFWSGIIDEVRVSDTARYSSGSFEPARHFETDGDTVLLWHFGCLTGQPSKVCDASGNGYDGTLNGSPASETRTEWSRSYEYDSVGNRVYLYKYDGVYDATEEHIYEYDGQGRLTDESWEDDYYHNTYSYDANGNLLYKTEDVDIDSVYSWIYYWDTQDRLVGVEKYDHIEMNYPVAVDYRYCAACGGALRERIEWVDDRDHITSWLRYEYDGLNLLRIDQRYDGSDQDTTIDEDDPWRPLNVYLHSPGQIGQIVGMRSFNYSGNSSAYSSYKDYSYQFDALGNVLSTLDSSGNITKYEMDAFGNRIPGSTQWPSITSNAVKEHITGKMYDEVTGLYYFGARWFSSATGIFLKRDKDPTEQFIFCRNSPVRFVDPDGKESVEPSPTPGEKKPTTASECIAQKGTYIETGKSGSGKYSNCHDCTLNGGTPSNPPSSKDPVTAGQTITDSEGKVTGVACCLLPNVVPHGGSCGNHSVFMELPSCKITECYRVSDPANKTVGICQFKYDCCDEARGQYKKWGLVAHLSCGNASAQCPGKGCE